MEDLYGRVLQISTLSEDELVGLKATLHALSDRRYLCSECISAHADRPHLLEKKQSQMACTKDAHDWGLHQIQDDGITYSFKRCIGNYFSQGALSWMSIFRAYEKGILPYPGGYQDQPNKAMEIIGAIETSKNIEQIKRMEEQKRKAQQAGRRGR